MKVRLKATGGAGSRSGDRRSGGQGGGGTFAAETDVADEDVAGDVHCEDVLSREEVEEVRVLRLLIHPQDPAIRVTLDAANRVSTLHIVR